MRIGYDSLGELFCHSLAMFRRTEDALLIFCGSREGVDSSPLRILLTLYFTRASNSHVKSQPSKIGALKTPLLPQRSIDHV